MKNYEKQTKLKNPILILVDGSNIVQYKWINGQKLALAKNLKKIRVYLTQLQQEYPEMNYIILIDHNLPNLIDQKKWLNTQIQDGKLFQCPSGYEADYYIIKYFLKNPDKIWVISKDQFRNYAKKNKLINNMLRYEIGYKNRQIEIPSLENALKKRYRTLEYEVILPIGLPKYLEGIF